MSRTTLSAGLVLMLCCLAAWPASADRSVEENIVISPAIVVGKITKATGDVKENGRTYKKFEAEATQLLRWPAADKKKPVSVTVLTVDKLKTGDELLLFLSGKREHGHVLHSAGKASDAKTVKKLLEFEARAATELGGKDKLRAAFFHAHAMRPMLLAAASGRGLKAKGLIPDKDRETLLSILAWAMTESGKKDAKAELKGLAEALRKVLSGNGGLPDVKTRQERLAQYWGRQLGNAKFRKLINIARLELTDKPADKVAVARQVQGARGQVVLVRPNVRPTSRPRPGSKPTPKPSLVAPSEASFGKPVSGLVVGVRTDRVEYDLEKSPDQPIQLMATFRNEGARSLRLNSYMVFPMLAQVYIVNPSGRLSAFSNKAALSGDELPAMGTWSFKEVKPKATLQFTETLPASLFRYDGEYQVYVVYRSNRGKRFGIADAWNGEVVSEKFPLRVIRQNAPAPKPKPTKTPKPVPPKKVRPVVPRPVLRQPVQIQKGGGQLRIQVQAVGNGVVQQQVIIKRNIKQPAKKK